jgi:hypothetical protein
MPLFKKPVNPEREALSKLIRQINSIDDDKNQVGRIVLAVFAFVFLAAATLMTVLMLDR